jgi:hypothetical protein
MKSIHLNVAKWTDVVARSGLPQEEAVQGIILLHGVADKEAVLDGILHMSIMQQLHSAGRHFMIRAETIFCETITVLAVLMKMTRLHLGKVAAADLPRAMHFHALQLDLAGEVRELR